MEDSCSSWPSVWVLPSWWWRRDERSEGGNVFFSSLRSCVPSEIWAVARERPSRGARAWALTRYARDNGSLARRPRCLSSARSRGVFSGLGRKKSRFCGRRPQCCRRKFARRVEPLCVRGRNKQEDGGGLAAGRNRVRGGEPLAQRTRSKASAARERRAAST